MSELIIGPKNKYKAAEAETAGLFHNAQMVVPISNILQARGHKQPPTPIKADNSTAHGFTYNIITIRYIL